MCELALVWCGLVGKHYYTVYQYRAHCTELLLLWRLLLLLLQAAWLIEQQLLINSRPSAMAAR
jgi:hypothetical protein